MSLKPVSRRTLLSSTLALSASAALAACSQGRDGKPQGGQDAELTIGLTYTPNIQFAPFYLAQQEGLYAPGVSLRHHGADEGLFDALLSGAEQVVVAGGDEAVVAASNGAELVVVAGFYQRYPVTIIVPEDSGVTELADLRGGSIGLPGRYGENWFALQLALEGAGLSEADVQVQEIGYTQQLALSTGRVEAIVGFTNNDAVRLRLGGTPVRELEVSADNPLLGASVITSRAVLDSHREALVALAQASAKGMERFCADPDAAVAATQRLQTDLVDPERVAGAREVAVATAALVKPSQTTTVGALVPAQVGSTIDFLAGHGLLGERALTTDDVCDALITVS